MNWHTRRKRRSMSVTEFLVTPVSLSMSRSPTLPLRSMPCHSKLGTRKEKHSAPRFGERVIYPSHYKPEAGEMFPVVGGEPVSPETAVALRNLLFGPNCHGGRPEWMRGSFVLCEPEAVFAYGLYAPRNGTKAVLMCVQAYILKQLLFRRGPSVMTVEGDSRDLLRELLQPSRSEQREALGYAIADMLWKAGSEGSRCTVCLSEQVPDEEEGHCTLEELTDNMKIFTFSRYDNLVDFLFKYTYVFQQEAGAGLILLLCSVLLSRGLERVQADMCGEHMELTSPQGDCHMSLVALLLTGRATPYLHNGSVISSDEQSAPIPQQGIMARSEIGLLLWKQSESETLETGSRLKTPMLPIWVTCIDEQYGVLFNHNRDLLRDHRAEHCFDLYYYNSSPFQTETTIINVDTRFNKNKEDYGLPLLEKLILTKWQGAAIKWKTSSTFV